MKNHFSAVGGLLLCALSLAWSTAASAVTISPPSITLTEGATKQFTASVHSTWTTSCGSVSTTGLYKARLYEGTCTVTATAGTQKATATVTVKTPIVMKPRTISTPQGNKQQFTASIPVKWYTKCGSITAGGLYTASGSVGQQCSIWAIAASGPAYTVYGWDRITTPTTKPPLTVSPTAATVVEAATKQFTASRAASWTTTCGSVSTSGLFTAPLKPGTCTITATATDGSGMKAPANATITSPIVITPSTASTVANQTQQFSANAAAKWTSSCGTISTSGLFTAPASGPATCTIQATAASGTAYTAFATDSVVPATQGLVVSPANPSVSEGATQQFTAGAGATWSATCGSIDPQAGLFTAPLVPGPCTITATATDGTGKTASTIASVSSPITLTPALLHTHEIGVQKFTASAPVTWTVSCGTIDSSGNFTAPAAPAESCSITATATGTPAYTAQAPVDVTTANYLTWKNDTARDGLRTDEQILTPSNVNSTSFGIAWSKSVDGGVWAQPLYINALNINGTNHNVLFVATSNDSVYAFDADTGAQLWTTSFLSAGVTAVAGASVDDIYIPQIGILGTPVIDPDSGTLYVVAETSEQNATYFPHRLHALDLTTGKEKLGGPVLISDPNLPPAHKLQRPGLLLSKGTVYVTLGSLGDKLPYHGFIFAFDENTLAQIAMWNDTPTGSAGGIWMSGSAPAADVDGNVFVAIGNGTLDQTSSFGQSVVKLSPGLKVLDYFAPYNYADQNAHDLDFGSGGVLIVPDQSGAYAHELITCGKPTPIFVLNRDGLGHVGTSGDNVIQRLDNQIGGSYTGRDLGQACFSTPAMWQQHVYFVGNGDVMKRFDLNPSTGLLSTTPVAQGTYAYKWPGGHPVISSAGTTNGIVWTDDYVTGTVQATDALTLKQLYQSATIDSGVKWAVPTVVNGHVYVGFQTKIVAFSTH